MPLEGMAARELASGALAALEKEARGSAKGVQAPPCPRLGRV